MRLERTVSAPKASYRSASFASFRFGVAVNASRQRAGNAETTSANVEAGAWCASSSTNVPKPRAQSGVFRTTLRTLRIIPMTMSAPGSFFFPQNTPTVALSPKRSRAFSSQLRRIRSVWTTTIARSPIREIAFSATSVFPLAHGPTTMPERLRRHAFAALRWSGCSRNGAL